MTQPTQREWLEQEVRASNFTIGCNVTDHRIESSYLQEVKAFRKHLLQEFGSMLGTSPESTTASGLMNTFAPYAIQVTLMAPMNQHLRAKNTPHVTIDEIQPYHRAIFG